MLRLIKITCLCLMVLGITCDGNGWFKEVSESEANTGSSSLASDVSESTSDSPVVDNSTQTQLSSSSESNDSSNSTGQTQQVDLSNTTESTTTSTEKPIPKQFGCTGRLWTGGLKFCWSRCENASTSTFWNTWCFTANALTETDKANYIECDSDDKCQPNNGKTWKCKSSCGMFSPHWDSTPTKLKD